METDSRGGGSVLYGIGTLIQIDSTYLCLDTSEVNRWIDDTFGNWERFWGTQPTSTTEAFSWINRSQVPIPKLGQMYWPNGMSRWAVGCFLATKDMVMELQPWEHARHSLRLGHGSGDNRIEADIVILPPIPLSYHNDQSLFLLVVVDYRFFARFENAYDDLESSFPIQQYDERYSWYKIGGGFFLGGKYSYSRGGDDTGGQAGWVSSSDSLLEELASDYLVPDIDTVLPSTKGNSNTRSVADIIDLVAANTGHEPVCSYRGTTVLTKVDDLTVFEENKAKGFQRIAGFFANELTDDDGNELDFSGSRLAKYLVMRFPVVHRFTGRPTGRYKDIQVDLHEQGHGKLSAANTCKAILDKEGNYSNESKLQTLAEKVADDIKARYKHSFDVVYAGICNWTPDPIVDVIEFTYSGDPQKCQTRIRSRPFSEMPTKFNHQDPDARRDTGVYYAELLDDLISGGNLTVDAILCDDSGSRLGSADDTVEVTLFATASDDIRNIIAFGAAFVDQKIRVDHAHPDSVGDSFRPIEGGFQTTLAKYATATGYTVYRDSTHATSYTIDVENDGLTGSVPNDTFIYATMTGGHGLVGGWVITAVEC